MSPLLDDPDITGYVTAVLTETFLPSRPFVPWPTSSQSSRNCWPTLHRKAMCNNVQYLRLKLQQMAESKPNRKQQTATE